MAAPSQEMLVSFTGGKKIVASYNDFAIATDQSVKNGGEASAPEPYDLFLASLATCAGIYVLNFCERRGIAPEGISLAQRWERDDKGQIATIALDIRLPSSFPAKYHSAVVRAAEQCAVKKTIDNPPSFVARVTVDAG